MTRSSLAFTACAAACGLCGLSWLLLAGEKGRAGALSDALASLAYMIYLPGGIIATVLLPKQNDGSLLYPLGLFFAAAIYASLLYWIGRSLRPLR